MSEAKSEASRPAAPRARIAALNHVGLTVADLDRSIAFYTSIFDVAVHGPWDRTGPGLGKVTGYPGCSVRQAFLDFGRRDQLIELLEYTNGGTVVDPANGNAGAAHFAVVVEDVDALYADLSARGHRFVSPPITTSPNPLFWGRVTYLIDPDGFRVELYQPLEA
ncbi:VOC family protein [Edaphosphingomonas haloaromaticamans]|uniref:Glyoxalase-like domain protein n=1 Tax=Edaphosphingomonas haloaromaticamans TaxID=653954 RepID=A0A1S1HFV7_9SPHN|nr:VOC family protein [Sphingomonas haloaromaticamans]OHT21159.1 Glyoxalase-like domain protein [Sphingomonas haloaromaticamans]